VLGYEKERILLLQNWSQSDLVALYKASLRWCTSDTFHKWWLSFNHTLPLLL